MQLEAMVRQSSAPDVLCEAVLSWTLCTYLVDPFLVSVIVVVAIAIAAFLYIRRKKLSPQTN
jgi:hypothetical protein